MATGLSREEVRRRVAEMRGEKVEEQDGDGEN